MGNALSKEELEKFDEGPKMLCAYCNSLWDGEMLRKFEDTVETNGYYGDKDLETTIQLEIKCSSCNKVLYVKEITVHNSVSG